MLLTGITLAAGFKGGRGHADLFFGATMGNMLAWVLNAPVEMFETALDQFPLAIVLSCIDSRTAPEMVFDAGIGDFFDVRVAGNMVNEDIAGCMEYATKVAGSKVILVMGHTGCGAVKGAVEDLKLGNLTGLLAKPKPAIDALGKSVGERASKNKKFVDAAALEKANLTIENIRRISPVLSELEKEGKILFTGCLFDIKTGPVTFLEDN